MTGPVLVSRGVVMPAQCDALGHMNVRWYVHAFDDGGFHLWPQVGIALGALRARDVAFVVAHLEIDYVRELRVGDLFAVVAGFTRLGHKSVTHESVMFDAETGETCATMSCTEVCFDLAARTSIPMPPEIAATLERALVSAPVDGWRLP